MQKNKIEKLKNYLRIFAQFNPETVRPYKKNEEIAFVVTFANSIETAQVLVYFLNIIFISC